MQNYYTLVAAQRKLASAQQSLREAQQFLDITQKQESGGEVAHSDVVKAQIQVAQRQRDAQDAELAVAQEPARRCRCSSSPTSATPSPSSTICRTLAPLPPLDRRAGDGGRPTARICASPQASVQQETFGIGVARGGVLPSVSFDYFYGINANQFATHSTPTPESDGVNLLGSVGAGAAERAALELGRGAEQAEAGAAARAAGARAT